MSKNIHKILFSSLAVFMAVVMAAFSPVRIFAARGSGSASKTAQNQYIKDIIIITEAEKDNLNRIEAYAGYTLINTPLSDLTANGGTKLYFAVATTPNPNEAITDIKAMNMNGDYDYQAYADYLAQFEQWADAKAETTLTGVREFKRNFKTKTPSAVFAYDMLNYLTEDGETPLGDALINFTGYDFERIIHDIVKKSNLAMLEYIRQLLLVACSETLAVDFVTSLLEHGYDNPLINGDYSEYNTAAADLINSLVDTNRMIKAYRDAKAIHGDDLNSYIEETNAAINKAIAESDEYSEMYMNAQEESKEIKDILSGELLCSLFDEVYYLDDHGNKIRLTDILAMDPTAEDQSKRPTMSMVLPIVALMSDGQRALAGCGFDKLVGSVVNEYNSNDSEAQKALESIQAIWDTAGNGGLISVYAGVELSLYDPNGIAMIGKAKETAAEAETGYNNFLGLPAYATGLMLAGATVGIAGSCALFRYSTKLVNLPSEIARVTETLEAAKATRTSLISDITTKVNAAETGWAKVNVAGKYTQGFMDVDSRINALSKELSGLQAAQASKISNAAVLLKAFAIFMFMFSVAMFITSLIALIQELSTEEEKDAEYLDVPRVLVDSIEYKDYDERKQMTTYNQLIYYKGIIDPFMSDEKAKTNLTPTKVMDVFDWSLTGSDREWIALYATKDGRVGNPILANDIQNTLAILVETSTASYTTLMNGYNDRVRLFGSDSYTKCGSGVIAFNHGDVKSETKTGLGQASMTIANGEFILFILLAAMAGAGIAVLSCFLIKKNKKKETA